MTDAINTQNRLQNNAIKADAKAKTKAGEGNASQQGKKAEASTIVELNNSNLLQKLSERVQQLPEINTIRVESVKQSLANGEYTPDAEVIAKKFSEIEKLLP